MTVSGSYAWLFDALSSTTFDRGLDEIEWTYNGRFDSSLPNLASVGFPIEVSARSLTHIDMRLLVPFYFHDDLTADMDGMAGRDKRRNIFKDCTSIGKDSVQCVNEAAGMLIVNLLYGGAQVPKPHLGYSLINGVGVKAKLFDGNELVDEVDIRGIPGWVKDESIEGLGNNPFIFDLHPIESALPKNR